MGRRGIDLAETISTYIPSPTLDRFHRSNAKVRGVKGNVGCLPCDAEFLSQSGWVRMDQWKPGMAVMQWDPEQAGDTPGIGRFVRAEYIVAPCKEFLKFSNRHSLSMRLSTEHRIPFYDWKNSLRVETAAYVAYKMASGLIEGPRFHVPVTFRVADGIDGAWLTDDQIRLMVAVHADGNFHPFYWKRNRPKCTIIVSRERKKIRLRELLTACGLEWKEAVYKGRPKETKFLFMAPVMTKTYGDLWWALGQRQLQIVYDEFPRWDGSITKDGEIRFYSISKSCADYIQFVCHATGHRATRTSVEYENPKWKTAYRVQATRRLDEKTTFRDAKVSTVAAEDGAMYCFKVPSGFFLARDNGRIFITGNSGKSSGCVMELFDRAMKQHVYNNRRRTRFAIIRNHYPDLITTSMKTWRDWVPETICPITMAAPIHGDTKRAAPNGVLLEDGTLLDMEVYFIALDNEEDVKKLKSLELTGAWINEAGEIIESVLKMLRTRVGRYPSKRQGGSNWRGVIMDTNPPDEESWWHRLAEEEKPKGFEFFSQPPAIIPLPKKDKNSPTVYVPNTGQGKYPPAENIEHLDEGFAYYLDQVAGNTHEWIKVFLMGQYGTTADGKPIYPEYNDDVHCAAENLVVFRALPLILGWDFGHPSCVFLQCTPRGQLRVIDELCSMDTMGIRQFARDVVKPHLAQHYGGMQIQSVGDPAGNERMQSDEVTCLQILSEVGIPTEMAVTNKFLSRREAVAGYLLKMVDGQPGFILSPKCKELRKGFQGKYVYRMMRMSTGLVHAKEAEKNQSSHCLVAGTMISMADGTQCAIESVKRGDRVIVPGGAGTVSNAWLSLRDAVCSEVELSNGARIVGTPDHRICVERGSGEPGAWIRIDGLQYGDVLLSINDERARCERIKNTQSKSSMGQSIIGNVRVTTRPTTTTKRLGICTAMFGSTIMAQSRLGITSTTETAIGRTTPFPTWIASKARNIIAATVRLIMQRIQNNWTEFADWRNEMQGNGIEVRQVGSGTANTLAKCGGQKLQRIESAHNVGASTLERLDSEGGISVPEHAPQPPAARAVSTTSNASAQFAEASSRSTDIPKPPHAVRIVGVRPCPDRRDVYDLTVPGANCFFANGVLVHNSQDCLSYAALRASGTTREDVTAPQNQSQNSGNDYARPVVTVDEVM